MQVAATSKHPRLLHSYLPCTIILAPYTMCRRASNIVTNLHQLTSHDTSYSALTTAHINTTTIKLNKLLQNKQITISKTLGKIRTLDCSSKPHKTAKINTILQRFLYINNTTTFERFLSTINSAVRHAAPPQELGTLSLLSKVRVERGWGAERGKKCQR